MLNIYNLSDKNIKNIYNLSIEDIKNIYNFDYLFYIKYYNDLKNLSQNNAINHYIKYGRNEKRIFCDINFKFDFKKYSLENNLLNENDKYNIWKNFIYNIPTLINNKKIIIDINNIENKNIYFHCNDYKKNNLDLKNFNEHQLYQHYYNYGYKEKRIYKNIDTLFNWLYYYNFNIDLKCNNINEIWRHYLHYGIIESRKINIDTILKVDYSDSNIMFTLKGILTDDIISKYKLIENKKLIENEKLIENKKFNIAIIYVFYNRPGEQKNETNLALFIKQAILKDKQNLYLIILNSTCEILFPKQDNLIIINNNNCYDFEAYGIGIKYLRQQSYHNLIKRYVLINCSVSGPFVDNWLNLFENKLIKTNSVLCTTVMYYIEGKKRTPGYFNYIINNDNIIDVLLNNVFIKHNTKKDCIINGEFGLADNIIKLGYNITALLDVNLRLRYGWLIDRHKNLDNYSIETLVFVKNIWRSVNGKSRDSLPVKYNDVNNFIFKNFNYKNNTTNNIEYNNLNIDTKINTFIWKNKTEFYEKYGKSEEFIVFPKIYNIQYKKVAIYAHSDKDNLFKDYCIQGVNSLFQLGYKVIILTTCSQFINVKIPYETYIYNNYKTDLHMYKTFLNTNLNLINKYNKIAFINDSLIFPIHGIEEMLKTINDMKKYDLWGIWSSPEMKEHYISSFLEFSNRAIIEFKNYLNKFKVEYVATTGGNSAVQQCEINLYQHFKNKYNCNCILDYRTLKNINNKTCPIMHPLIFPQWINNKKIFAIKWKYIGNYLDKDNYNLPYMNYLLRFIHFNHTGPPGHPEKNNVWGPPELYVKINKLSF